MTGGWPTGGASAAAPWGIAVLGVGNPDRGDDGVGPAVVAALAGRLPADVALAVLDAEPSRLMDAWFPAGLVLVVDAAAPSPDGGVPSGTVCILEIDAADPAGPRPGSAVAGPQRSPGSPPLPELAVSSHGSGVGTAVALAGVLGRLPRRLVIVAVTGATFDLGAPMSESVRAAVPLAADTVIAAVRRGHPTTTARPPPVSPVMPGAAVAPFQCS
ncbi:MAG TPA: hydrogenase maturation protease [Kineosporiaceae bacterium]